MSFLATAASSGVLTGLLLLAGPPPPLGAVATLLALWLMPGYALQAAVMPGTGHRLHWAERIALSVGLSLAVLAAMGVGLDALGARLTAPALVWTACGVTQLASLGGLARALLHRERTPLRSHVLPSRSWWAPGVAAGIVIAGGVSALALKPPPAIDRYVELSILDDHGRVPVMPLQAGVGQARTFIIQISSHDIAPAEYVLNVAGPDRVVSAARRFVLAPMETAKLAIVATWTSSGHRAWRITLDRGNTRAFRSLNLAVAVTR